MYPEEFLPFIRVGYLRSRRYPPIPQEDIEQIACMVAIMVESDWKRWRREFDNEYERTLRELGYRKVKEANGDRRWLDELSWYKRGRRPGAPIGNKNRKGKKVYKDCRVSNGGKNHAKTSETEGDRSERS